MMDLGGGDGDYDIVWNIYSLKFYEYNLRSKFALRKLYTYKHVPLFKNLCSILTLFLIQISGKE